MVNDIDDEFENQKEKVYEFISFIDEKTNEFPERLTQNAGYQILLRDKPLRTDDKIKAKRADSNILGQKIEKKKAGTSVAK